MHEILYVNKCLQLIEAKLNWGSRETWVYEDFKRLRSLIFEASSISLSVHTLERLFGKLKTHKNYNPQAETKNALAVFLGYKDWNQFREQNPILLEQPAVSSQRAEVLASVPAQVAGGRPAAEDRQAQVETDPAERPFRQRARQTPVDDALLQSWKRFWPLLFVFFCLIAVVFFFYYQQHLGKETNTAARLKTNNAFGRRPHTVKFTYRIPAWLAQEVYADFATADPLWKIDRKEKHFFKTYLSPGIFPVRLITRDTVLARTNVFIESKGWLGYKYDIYEDIKTRTPLPQDRIVSKGRLYTDPEKVDPQLKNNKYYFEYTRVKDFQVSGDHLTFATRFRSNAGNGGQLCNDMWFKLVGTHGELKMHFLVPGCFGFVQMIFGEKKLDGHAKDLSAFARDIADWKNARMEVVNKKVNIYFQDELIYKMEYQQPIGDIMAISITSKGAGETDFVKLYNARKKLVFADDFE